MEGPVGLEPTTPCLKGRCSNQLSYGPKTPYIICNLAKKSILAFVFLGMFGKAAGLGTLHP